MIATIPPMPGRTSLSRRSRFAALLVAALSLGACENNGPKADNVPAPDPQAAELATMNAPTRQVLRAQTIVNEARDLERAGRNVEAITKYREAIAVYREFPAAWNNLAVVLAKEKRNLEAAEAFRIAADLAPTDPRPLTNLGDLWFNQGYLEDAGKYYSAALERDSDWLPALRQAVRVDHLRQISDENTSERIRKALLQETDDTWRQYLERRKLQVDQHLRDRTGRGLH